MRAACALLVLMLVGCAGRQSAGAQQDLFRAMDVWAQSGVEDYAYEIEYWAQGCNFFRARIVVRNGKSTGKSKLLRSDTCEEHLENLRSRFLSRNVADLFAEIISYQQPGLAHAVSPTQSRFDGALGYPILFQLDDAFGNTVRIDKDGHAPPDYMFKIASLEVL